MTEVVTRRIKSEDEIRSLNVNNHGAFHNPGFIDTMPKYCGKTYEFNKGSSGMDYYLPANSSQGLSYTWAGAWLEEPFSEIELAEIEWNKKQESK